MQNQAMANLKLRTTQHNTKAGTHATVILVLKEKKFKLKCLTAVLRNEI